MSQTLTITAVQAIALVEEEFDDTENTELRPANPGEVPAVYSVYIRMADGTADHIADCCTPNQADLVANALAAYCKVPICPKNYMKASH